MQKSEKAKNEACGNVPVRRTARQKHVISESALINCIDIP